MTQPMMHLGFDGTHGAKYALLPGDPGRVEKIAALLENPRFFHQKREYTTWVGQLCGENVLVMSTGMGGPSTAIAAEELYQTGVHTMIRVGTCGGMAKEVMGGHLVVAQAAIRAEGTSHEYLPAAFPAVANLAVTNALVQGCGDIGVPHHVGVVHCKDSFYGQKEMGRMPIAAQLQQNWQAWLAAGCLASEMESAALYITCQVLGARAGCVLNTAWNQERARLGLENPTTEDPTPAIKAALKAVRRLIEADRQAAS